MKTMLRICTLSLLLGLVGCASTAGRPDYVAADAGTVVLGIGVATGTSYSTYSLEFRSIDPDSGRPKRSGFFYWHQTNPFGRQAPDYSSDKESGIVSVRQLPPGQYEIHRVKLTAGSALSGTSEYTSNKPFSIPFLVRSGETTYLGNFQANPVSSRRVLWMSVAGPAVFAVSDRQQAELALANSKGARIPLPVVSAVPSPMQINSPLFVPPHVLAR
jgi:hypothetical protein